MEQVKKIIVSIQLNEEEIELGELISEARFIYFKYYDSFIILLGHRKKELLVSIFLLDN
jgi:hypothetical protein